MEPRTRGKKLRSRLFQEKFYREQRNELDLLEQTGEGTFEVPRKKIPAKPKEEDNEDRIQTIAEQKMNKSLKKIQKSKIPKWNPNDWQIDDGKARVRIKGRHWDDVSVPRWVRNCDTDRRRWGLAIRDPPRDTRVSGRKRHESVGYSGQQSQQPQIVPETGTIFLRKSKSVKEVFFSSIGNMSTTCAALPAPAITILTPPPSPPNQEPTLETAEEVSSSLSNEESIRSASDHGDSNSPVPSKSESEDNSTKAQFVLENVSVCLSMETDSLNNADAESENPSLILSLGNSLDYGPLLTEDQEMPKKLYTPQSPNLTTSSEAEDDNLLSGQFSKDCSLSPSPPVAISSPADSHQEHFEEISRDSLLMFHDLEKWKLVHYSRVANWILERVKSDAQYSEERWNCVVGETGDFQFCVSPDKLYEISFGHVTVILFKTNI